MCCLPNTLTSAKNPYIVSHSLSLTESERHTHAMCNDLRRNLTTSAFQGPYFLRHQKIFKHFQQKSKDNQGFFVKSNPASGISRTGLASSLCPPKVKPALP